VPRPVIKLENVSWRYARSREPALAGISLEVGEGEFVAVMGGGGAGKSSLCRLLNGLIPHSSAGRLSGSVEIDGEPTASSSVARLSEKVGMAFDDPETQLFTARAFDEVAFALENMLMPPAQIAEKTRRALAAAGLSECADRAPATLSGGQKQRLAIAAALAMANRVLVLDEPGSRLDPEGVREVLSFVRKLRGDRRMAVVMATGSAEEALDFADRACVLKNGRLLAFDAPDRVFSNARLLAEAGIDPPEVCAFAFRMGALGKALPRFPLTVAEAAESALAAVGNRAAGYSAASREAGPGSAGPDPRSGVPALQIEDVSFSYESSPRAAALDGFSLSVADGEFVALLGRNGSGKTTLLKAVSGLLRPRRGRILARGRETREMSVAEIAGEVGYVMQDSDNQLFEQTVFDEVAFALRLQKRGAAQIRLMAEEALEALGLQDMRGAFPPALRKADRVKTVFAAVLAMGAKTLILDEPLAGQDCGGARTILEALGRLREKGRSIVMTTHDVRAAAEHAQRLVVMKSGRAHLDGSAEEVFGRAGELAEAGILLPRASLLALELRGRIPVERISASPEALAEDIARLAPG